MPATYRDILDLFDAQKATNNYQSLPEYAASLNDLTGTQNFDAGLKDSWVKRASVGLDRAIESTGAPDALGSFFGDIGGSFGYRDAGEAAGRALPRGIVNFAPMMVAAALTGGGSAIAQGAAGLLGAGATALSSGLTGAEAYTNTGSPLAGLLSGAALPVAGVAAHLGGQLALKAIGAPLLEGVAKPLSRIVSEGLLPAFTPEVQAGLGQVGGRVAETLGQRVASYLGGQTAALSVFEAANEATSVVTGQGLYNPLEPEKLFGTLIGQLPFAALDIPRVARATPAVDSMRRFLTTEVKNKDASDSLTNIPLKTGASTEDAGQLVKKLSDILKAKKVVDEDTTLTEEQKNAKIDELMNAVGKVSESTQGTGLEGKGYDEYLNSVVEAHKETQVANTIKELDKVKIETSKVEQANTTVAKVESMEPPKDLSEVLSQVDEVAKAGVDSGAASVSTESLKENLTQVEPVITNSDDSVIKALQVEKNKVSRSASLKAATAASVVAKESRFATRLQDLGNREELGKTSHPNAKQYRDDLAEIGKFLKVNDEQVGEGKAATTSLSRAAINAYYNWEEAGRLDGYAGLQSRMGKAKQMQRREATVSRETLKVDGSIDANADKVAKRFATRDAAVEYAKTNGVEAQPQPRKGGKWFVLERTKKADKVSSLHTETGEQRSVVSAEVEQDFFSQIDQGTESGGEEATHDEVGSLIATVEDEQSKVTLVGKTVWDDLISSVNNLDDEVVHGEFMHVMEGDVEEHTKDIQTVRNRMVAILELQKQHGNKSVNDPKFFDELNLKIPKPSRFADDKELRDFNTDPGTQRLLLEASKKLIEAGHTLPSDPHGGWSSIDTSVGSSENGSFKGLKDLTPDQQNIVDTYQLTGEHAMGPLAAVAKSDKGLLGTLARALSASFGDRLKEVKLANMRVKDGQFFTRAEYDPGLDTILYGRDLLPVGPATRFDINYLNEIIVHETLHALTHDAIRNSPEEKVNLDALRMKAVGFLPKEIREIHEKSQAEGKYKQYQADRSVRLYDLTPKQLQWHGILYALENTDEFISQSFSSSHMQEFLRKQAPTRKGNLFSTFVNYVKGLLNLYHVDDSLFHDVIAATDRLLNPQLRKPFETETILNGVMGKFGLAPKQLEERVGTAKSVLSLLTHVSNKIQDQAGYREILNGTIADAFLTAHEKGLLEPEDVRKLNTAQSWYDNLDESNQKIVNGLFQVEGKDEVKTVADILHSTIQRLGNPEKRDQFIRDLFYVDEPIKDVISSLRRYTTTVTSSVNEVMVGAKKGLVNEITDSPGISHVKDLYGTMLDLLTAEKRLKANADRFAELNKVSPEGFRVAQADAPSPAPRDENQRTIAEEMGIVKPSFMSRTFEPLAQLAEKYPIMRDALYKVFKHQGDVREAVRRALLPFSGEFGKDGEVTFSKGKLQKAYEVAQSVEMNRAVSDIRRKMNEGKMAFDPQAAEFQDTLNGLSVNQRPRVIEFVNQLTQSMKVMQDTILARQSELGTISLAQIIQSRQPELRVGQSMTLAKTMNQALQMMDVPETAGQGQAILSSVQGRLSPEVLQETLRFAVEDKMRLKGLQGFYASRPWFSTEQRFKRFLLTMVDKDGDNHTSDYDNERQAAQAKRRLEGQGFSFTSVVDRKGNDNHPSFNQDAMIDEVRKLNERRLGQISQMMSGEPELLDQIRGYLKIDEDLTRSKIAKGLTEKGSQQQLKGGREELNMIQGHVSYINQVVNNQTAKVTRAGMTLSLMDGELKAQPELTKIAKQALDNYMRPDTEAGRALTRANFLYFMGMNPSTMLMEMGQSSLSLIPTMINEGMSIQKAYGATIATAAEIAKYGVTGKWNNPEHELVMNRAGARGDIMLSGLGDVMDDNAHASIGLSQLATGEEPTSISSLVKKPLAMYEKLATGIYSKFPAFNARMALLTSFDHFRSQGMDFEEAFANAERINNVANFAGGRAARPVGFFSPEGKAGRTASMALYSLQSYTTGMISMMGRYMMRGFGDLGKDLNPRDRANAKKAAVIMFGTQLAAAGALGLPGIGAGIALLEQIFPNLELNKAIRENLAKLGGDDKELGAFISDTALRGLPNQLGGVDVGSRLSLGNNVMGLSSYDGFDVANILGPSFNLFKNMAVGVSQAAQGEVGQAAQTILPPAYKKIIQLSQGGGDIRDNSGKLLLQPSMGEKFSMLLGFQPKSLSDLKDAKRIESRSQEIGRRETIQFNSQVADALQAGDQVALKSLLSTKLKEDNTFDPRSAIRAGAALVEQRTLPLDLARTSKAPDLLSTYQIAAKPVSEVQRLQIRKQVESSTGIPGVGRMTANDIQQAQLVDQLMAKGLTRDEARAKIESLHPSSTKLALPSF